MAGLILAVSVRGAPAAVGLRPGSVYDTDVGHMLEPMMQPQAQPLMQETPLSRGRNDSGVNGTAARHSDLLGPLLASQPTSQALVQSQHRRNRLVAILLDHSASMAAAHQPWIALGARLVNAGRRVSALPKSCTRMLKSPPLHTRPLDFCLRTRPHVVPGGEGVCWTLADCEHEQARQPPPFYNPTRLSQPRVSPRMPSFVQLALTGHPFCRCADESSTLIRRRSGETNLPLPYIGKTYHDAAQSFEGVVSLTTAGEFVCGSGRQTFVRFCYLVYPGALATARRRADSQRNARTTLTVVLRCCGQTARAHTLFHSQPRGRKRQNSSRSSV